MSKLIILLTAAMLLAGCGFHARSFLCRPSQPAAKIWACQHLGYCGQNAGLVLVGNTYVFSSDVTSAKADWTTIDPLPHEVQCSK